MLKALAHELGIGNARSLQTVGRVLSVDKRHLDFDHSV